MQTAAVLPALGIGDALLMMIASHQLKMEGYRVTTFHDALFELAPWFPGHDFQPVPPSDKLTHAFSSFDLLLVENDNSPKIKQLLGAFRHSLAIFYPTYSSHKHAPLASQDRTFDKDLPMADNIAEAIASLFDQYCARLGFANSDSARQSKTEAKRPNEEDHSRVGKADEEDRFGKVAANQNSQNLSGRSIPAPSKENGLTPPANLNHRAHQRRVILHPTSRETAKNWRPNGFLAVANALKNKGYSPVFCVGPKELADWKFVEDKGFQLADAPTLSDLAAFIYESGFVIGNDSLIGHLASNLQIPTLIIANDEKRMRLWRPGWLKGQLVLPPPYLPNWKFLRLKEKKWQHFITSGQVLRRFEQLAGAL